MKCPYCDEDYGKAVLTNVKLLRSHIFYDHKDKVLDLITTRIEQDLKKEGGGN